jgi:hypothetical protein
MFSQIERELLDGEHWLIGYHSQLLLSGQLLDEKEQGIVDIWELQPQELSHREEVTKRNFNLFGFLGKLNFFSVKAITNKTKKRLI